MKHYVIPDETHSLYKPCALDVAIKAERSLDPDVPALYEVGRIITQSLALAGNDVTRQAVPHGELVMRYHVAVPQTQQEQETRAVSAKPEKDEKKKGSKARTVPVPAGQAALSTVLEAYAPIIKSVFNAASKKLLFKVMLEVDGNDFEVSAADVEGSERVSKFAKRLLTQDTQLAVTDQSQLCLNVSVPKRLPSFNFSVC